MTWTVTDHHNTGEAMVRNSDQMVSRRRTEPFGQPRGAAPSWWAGDKGFLNGTVDPTGLTHLGARLYDPGLGRFVSVDPIMDLTDPQQMHGYAYANNNPTTWSDPTGLLLNGGLACIDVCGGATDRSAQGLPPVKPRPKSSSNGAPVAATGGAGAFVAGAIQGFNNYGKDAAEGIVAFVDSPVDAFRAMADHGNYWNVRYTGIPISVSPGFNHVGSFCVLSGLCEIYENWNAGDYYSAGYGTGSLAAEATLAGSTAAAGPAAGGVLRTLTSLLRRTGCKSFSATTLVLMVDGTLKRISEIKVGEEVLATDPESGVEGGYVVTYVWVHDDTLIDFTTESGTIVTTEDHLFWNETGKQWQRANALDRGDHLLSTEGRTVTAYGFMPHTAHVARAYTLTVADLHTYYVLAGKTPVLVHNCNAGPPSRFAVDSSGVAADLRPGLVEGPAPRQAYDMLAMIDNRVGGIGKVPGYGGNRNYANRSGALPSGVKYREWELYPENSIACPRGCGGTAPGAERIVTGVDGSAYYTPDHYGTFFRIR